MAEWTQDGEQPFSAEDAWIDGCDFPIVFDNALVGGLDEEFDELLADLAAAAGIDEVIQEDTEVLHLKVDDLDASALEETDAEAVEQAGIRYEWCASTSRTREALVEAAGAAISAPTARDVRISA